jgi:hypothetical protein
MLKRGLLLFSLSLSGGLFLSCVAAFTTNSISQIRSKTISLHRDFSLSDSSSSSDRLRQEAEELLARARALRKDIPEERQQTTTTTAVPAVSPWSIQDISEEEEEEEEEGVEYRLNVDIGREPGTWMDPRWGASGKRIEFTLNVRFQTDGAVADTETRKGMIQDNFGGKSSPIYPLRSAENARLRKGFDKMKCSGGGYRMDVAKGAGMGTIRFFVRVDGTLDASYGDISIPQGSLFFSLPAFGGKVSQLSQKEGPVTVQQMGWHTGLRREESRIVGVFRAVPIADATRRDGF